MCTALEGSATFATDKLPGKAVTLQVLFVFINDAFLGFSLPHRFGSLVKILVADDCLVVILMKVHVLLTIVDMAVEAFISKGLL